MEEKKPISHIVAGLVIFALIFVSSIGLNLAVGNGADPRGGWISYLVMIAGLVFFIQKFGKAHNYHATFGELFSYGFKSTTMIVLLFVILLIIVSFAVPEMKQKAVELTRSELERQGKMGEKDIDSAMQLTNKYFWVILIGTSMFFFVVIGSIGSLIGAAITKKQPKNPF